MNRLILVGNGMDLAHGYKTTYNDFILQYLKTSYLNSLTTKGKTEAIDRHHRIDYAHNFDDDLINITLKTKYSNIRYEDEIQKITSLGELNDFAKRLDFPKHLKSTFIRDTINHCEKLNWVDIENEYFKNLLSIKDKFLQRKGVKNLDELILLNKHLNVLSTELEQYLSSLAIVDHSKEIARLKDLILSPIIKQEVATIRLAKNEKPKNIYFLNFNYTPTLNSYIKSISEIIPCSINHIHGELGNEFNPIIFGFGDEIDKSYKEIEELNENEYFKHIKSFRYFRTSKYHDLVRFLEADNFQIFIMGHSCGLSDRTLLNQVFEHDNCMSIKIFYHQRHDGSNDFTEKTFEMSRHFKDKTSMRKKIVPFQTSFPMPNIS